MKFPRTRFPVAPVRIAMPSVLPEMTLRATGLLPPIVLFDAPSCSRMPAPLPKVLGKPIRSTPIQFPAIVLPVAPAPAICTPGDRIPGDQIRDVRSRATDRVADRFNAHARGVRGAAVPVHVVPIRFPSSTVIAAASKDHATQRKAADDEPRTVLALPSSTRPLLLPAARRSTR